MEEEKYKELYKRTKETYEATFGEAPPEDIWPSTEIRFRNTYIRIDISRHLVIRVEDFPIISKITALLLRTSLWVCRIFNR